jgi:hypothetical protein
MGKTIVPIKSKGYKIVHGELSGATNTENALTVTLPNKIVAVFYYATLKTTTSTTRRVSGYYINSTSAFYNGFESMFDNTYPISNPRCYTSAGSVDIYSTKVDENSVKFNTGTASDPTTMYYTAIVEDNLEDDTRSIFLLNGTILYTDGTPTTDVADAIKTLDTNKYKIKSNALVNISNATYINLSN